MRVTVCSLLILKSLLFIACTTRFSFRKFYILSTQSICVFCMTSRTNSDFFFLYSINWLVFVTETECVYSAVRTEHLNTIQVTCSVWISEQTAIISLHSINWMVFITESGVFTARYEQNLFITFSCYSWKGDSSVTNHHLFATRQAHSYSDSCDNIVNMSHRILGSVKVKGFDICAAAHCALFI
jgi:hypothetical protein